MSCCYYHYVSGGGGGAPVVVVVVVMMMVVMVAMCVGGKGRGKGNPVVPLGSPSKYTQTELLLR